MGTTTGPRRPRPERWERAADVAIVLMALGQAGALSAVGLPTPIVAIPVAVAAFCLYFAVRGH